MPTVRDGFSIELVESSDTSVVALDGSVVHSKEDKIITLKFKVTNNADPDDVAYVISTVKVLGYGEPESDNKAPSDTTEQTNDKKPTIQTVVKDDDWDLGIGGDWNTGNGVADGNAGDGDSLTADGGSTLNMLVIILLVFAIIMVLGLTFMVLLAMKKKADERNQNN